MRMYDLIEKKRDGHSLSEQEIKYIIDHYVKGDIPDYQMSAFLMAVYFQGMSLEESSHLTRAMVDSGQRIDLHAIKGIKVDKHSTGGVGDTTTLILAPLLASLGVKVAKMSGRGLGHTGGTLDKLESFPNFSIEVNNERFIQLVNEHNLAVIGQSADLAPADKSLYSLRDVTATVNSIPLIASSIMSKKIASGANAIVLDVKLGSGAFMQSEADAIALAETMVAIGKQNGVETSAIISNMDEPLGKAVGNILEVKEAIDTLCGKGPEDIRDLTFSLAKELLIQAHVTADEDLAMHLLHDAVDSGKALGKMKEFIAAQGGDSSYVDNPDLFPQATIIEAVTTDRSGYVQAIDAEKVGKAAMILGAGRERKDSEIDLTVGVIVEQKTGQAIKAGQTLFTVHGNDRNKVQDAIQLLETSVDIGEEVIRKPLIIQTIK